MTPGGPGAPAFYPGMRLDRYELLCPLAQGGMGAVWLARYLGKFDFSRLVVVKVILPELARETAMRTMFIDEARIAGGIDHPNVVRTLDVGEDHGTVFMVMDWVDGDSLSRLVKQVRQSGERMPAGIVLKVALDVAQGLHAAHELREPNGELLGVIHRDVSPQNVLLAVDGRAMLIDFGIAKANKRMTAATAVGRIKGKIAYMAPEQARNTNVDRRADIFAVGAMLYELFSGAPPFEKENDVATLTRLMRGGPAAPLPDSVPAPVQHLVMHALELDPNMRFQTAANLADALANAMHEIGAAATENEVARYANDYLSARRATRKRTVNSALAARAAVVAEPLLPLAPVALSSASASFAQARPPSAAPPPFRPGTHVTLEGEASPFASALGDYESGEGENDAAEALVPFHASPTQVDATRRQPVQAPRNAQPQIMWPTFQPAARAAGTPWAFVAIASIAASFLLAAVLIAVKLSHEPQPVAEPLPLITVNPIVPTQPAPIAPPIVTQPAPTVTSRPPVVQVTNLPRASAEPTATWTVTTIPKTPAPRANKPAP